METATLSRDPRPTYTLLQAVASALAHAGRRANLEGAGDGSAYFAAARHFSPGSAAYARLLRAGTRQGFQEELEAILASVADPAVRRVVEDELANTAAA
jgi:hypothetical protein